MVASKTIILVASESAFRRSLEFALEVEGFSVESHALLSEAEASPAAASAVCAIIDEGALLAKTGAFRSLDWIEMPVIMLVDGIPATATEKGTTVLTKPLRGNDLADAIDGIFAV